MTTEGETQQMKKTILMFAMFVMAFIAEGTVRAWADNPMPVPIPKLAALAQATDNPMPVPIPKLSALARATDNPMPVPIPKLSALAQATDNPMPVPIPKASGLAL